MQYFYNIVILVRNNKNIIVIVNNIINILFNIIDNIYNKY